MTTADDITIRVYQPADRAAVRRISRETAFFEAGRWGDGEWLADALTMYYTDHEPGSCFVAVQGDAVIGYVTGALDETRARRVTRLRVLPRLCGRLIAAGFPFDATLRRLAGECLRCALKGEFRRPRFHRDYPAELHVNLAATARRRGIGRRLVAAFAEYARTHGAAGIQVSVLSDPARAFFAAQGFEVLFETQRTFLQNTPDEKAPWYIMGKKLSQTEAEELRGFA